MYKILLALVVFLFSSHSLYNSSHKEINISNIVFNHLSDSHTWHIVGNKNKFLNFVFHLPIILCDHYKIIYLKHNQVSDIGYKNLMTRPKKYYVMINDIIYRSNYQGDIYLNKQGKIINYKPIDLSITKTVMSIFLSSIIMMFMFVIIRFNYNQYYISAYKLGSIIDFLIIFIRNFIVLPNFGNKNCNKFLPFFLTLFFYIFINNLLGLLPFSINITGNYNVTLCLSIIVLIFFVFNTKLSYWKHLLYPNHIPGFARIFVIPIECISILIKPFTLCIRLFSNITAGHIISIVFISLILVFKNIVFIIFSVSFSIFIYLLEFFVSFIQAFIFTYLSAIFISNAVNE